MALSGRRQKVIHTKNITISLLFIASMGTRTSQYSIQASFSSCLYCILYDDASYLFVLGEPLCLQDESIKTFPGLSHSIKLRIIIIFLGAVPASNIDMVT